MSQSLNKSINESIDQVIIPYLSFYRIDLLSNGVVIDTAVSLPWSFSVDVSVHIGGGIGSFDVQVS